MKPREIIANQFDLIQNAIHKTEKRQSFEDFLNEKYMESDIPRERLSVSLEILKMLTAVVVIVLWGMLLSLI